MCGIFLLVTKLEFPLDPKIFDHSKIRSYLKRRGPDYHQSVNFKIGKFQFHMESSVLHLRGPRGSGRQPFQNQLNSNEQSPNRLQWNGQIFRMIFNKNSLNDNEDFIEFTTIPDSRSDTEELFTIISKAQDECLSDEVILETLSSIHGPWSMTYWNEKKRKLWVGRDFVGRRSLCWNKNFRDKFLIITSVVHLFDSENTDSLFSSSLRRFKFEEIPSDRIFCFDFDMNIEDDDDLSKIWNNVKQFYWPKNLAGFPSPGIESCALNLILPRSPIQSQFNYVQPLEELDQLLKQCSITDSAKGFEIPAAICEEFIQVLSISVGTRCLNHHNRCRQCLLSDQDSYCPHSTIAILFSGGLDSTVLALLSHQVIKPESRPIDLLNVAFDSKSPDRQTGLDAWQELCQLFPQRKWNFIEINVDSEELYHYRQDHISFLIEPNSTVMDDSIGCSLWFATRGKGLLRQMEPKNTEITNEYRTPAQVVLIGMGADEQLGGYSRHRQAFQKGHWSALLREMYLDIERISRRNLGRDDRVTADHGIEARFPYLDEIVIEFLNQLPIWIKCNLYLPRGYGEKWLLRTVAQKLGLRKSCHNLKRAIQFGSKITLYQESSLKGHDSMFTRSKVHNEIC